MAETSSTQILGDAQWLSQRGQELWRDPFGPVVRQRQTQLYVATATSILVQIGLLAESKEGTVTILGFVLRGSELHLISTFLIALVVGYMLLFSFSAWRDHKVYKFLVLPAWKEIATLGQEASDRTLQLMLENEDLALATDVPGAEESLRSEIAGAKTALRNARDSHKSIQERTPERRRLMELNGMAASSTFAVSVQGLELLGRVVRLRSEVESAPSDAERTRLKAELSRLEAQQAQIPTLDDETAARLSTDADRRLDVQERLMKALLADMNHVSRVRTFVDGVQRADAFALLLEVSLPLMCGAVAILLFALGR